MIDLPGTHWSDTEHYGLLGTPIRKSLSPLIHNTNFEAMGMNAIYYPIDIDERALEKIMPALPILRYKGLNVTMPLKKAVMPFLDEIDEMGSLCGAVNTIANRNGRMIGTNTDGTGFVHSLRQQGRIDPEGKSCVLFGSGGAGRGISFALAGAKIGQLTIVDRAEARPMLEALVGALNSYKNGVAKALFLDDGELENAVRQADIAINATCVGMAPIPDAVVCDCALFSPRQTVCDIVYTPHRTKMLEAAEARGCRTLEGHWMLLWQAVDAFRFWTGSEPNVAAMQEAVVRSVTRRPFS